VEYGLDLYAVILEENVSRVIYHSFWEDEGEVGAVSFKDDDVETCCAYDDDYIRDVYKSYDDDDLKRGTEDVDESIGTVIIFQTVIRSMKWTWL
jgi:hypothetical protein